MNDVRFLSDPVVVLRFDLEERDTNGTMEDGTSAFELKSSKSKFLNATASGLPAFVCWWFEADLTLQQQRGKYAKSTGGGVRIDSDPRRQWANHNRQHHWGQACTATSFRGSDKRPSVANVAPDISAGATERTATSRLELLEAAVAKAQEEEVSASTTIRYRSGTQERTLNQRGFKRKTEKPRNSFRKFRDTNDGEVGYEQAPTGTDDSITEWRVKEGDKMLLTVAFDTSGIWPTPVFDLSLARFSLARITKK
mmetsp:Transcript_56428/g.97160  ORF Transcript_56428/g.97160 Transcript_56428/m.97160 type:complete len:253 (+) Transcript_56428:72-830(+)